MADDPLLSKDDLDAMAFEWNALDIEDLNRVLRTKKRRHSASAARLRRYRRRKRRGEIVFKVTVEENLIVGFLLSTGRVTEAESVVRDRIEHAVAPVLEELATRWRSDKV